MYQISQENRDTIINYLEGSRLPHADVVQLVNLLKNLEKVEEEE